MRSRSRLDPNNPNKFVDRIWQISIPCYWPISATWMVLGYSTWPPYATWVLHLAMQAVLQAPLGLHWALLAGLYVELKL